MRAYKALVKIDGVQKIVAVINQNENEKEVVKQSVEVVNHIKILDSSGSMWGNFHRLIDDVKKSVEVIGEDDYMTIIIFSSPGQFRTVIKGVKKCDNLIKLIDGIQFIDGTTCFSDPIREAKNVIEDLKALCPNFSITLFTDGQPCLNSWSIEEEKVRVEQILESMKDSIMAFNTIGYGPYADENFLKFMSSYSEFGQYVHSENISDYSEIFTKNFERINDAVVEKVNIKTKFPIVYLNRKMTKMFQAPSINFNRLSKDKNQFFIVGDGEFSFEYNGETINTKDITETINSVTEMNFWYSYAYNLFCIGKRAEALVIYAQKCADKEAVDRLQNCFTVVEIEEVRKFLEEMVTDVNRRYQSGKCPNNYIPRKDAHCVLDILQELASSLCYYVPFHNEADDYERITRKVTDLTDTFIKSKETQYSMIEEFVFHKTKLNISVKYAMKGTIKVSPQDELGMDEVPVVSFKTHTILKDGNLNMKSMVLFVPTDVVQSLKDKFTKVDVLSGETKIKKELKKEHGYDYELIKLHFGNKPLINRLYLDQSSNSSIILTNAMDIAKLEARQAFLNHYIGIVNEANPVAVKEGIFKGFKKDQIELLKTKYGISSQGWYYPKNTFVPKTGFCDSYPVKEMSFVFKGLSDLPSVSEYFEKKNTGKKMTLGMTIMESGYEWFKDTIKDGGFEITDTSVKYLRFLKDKKRAITTLLSSIRRDMAAIKLAKFLNHDDFTGLETDEKGNRFFKAPDDNLLYVKTKEGVEYL